MRRLPVAAVLVLALAGCASPPGTTGEPSPEVTSPVTAEFPQLEATEVAGTLFAAMREAGPFWFDLSTTVIVGGEPIELTMSGAMHLRESGPDLQSSFKLDTPDRPLVGDMAVVDGIRYVRGGFLFAIERGLPPDVWVRLDAGDPDIPEVLVNLVDEIESEADPLLPLRLLEAAVELRPLGVDDLLRDEVMRYEGRIDLGGLRPADSEDRQAGELPQSLTEVPFTLTVDRDNLPREINLTLAHGRISTVVTYRSYAGVAPVSAPEESRTWAELRGE